MRGISRPHFKRVRSKYRNIKCEVDGIKFDSIGERNCYQILKVLERAGKFKILALQEKLYLSKAKILYKPDFTVFDVEMNETYWVDFKGVKTASFSLKKRLWKAYGPGRLRLAKLAQDKSYGLVFFDDAISSLGRWRGCRDMTNIDRRIRAPAFEG